MAYTYMGMIGLLDLKANFVFINICLAYNQSALSLVLVESTFVQVLDSSYGFPKGFGQAFSEPEPLLNLS